MNLCSDGHDEIVFEEHRCPLCALMADMDKQIDALKDQIADLEKQLAEQTP